MQLPSLSFFGDECRMLSSVEAQADIAVQALQVVSQVARIDPHNAGALDRANICSRVRTLSVR